MRSGSYKIEVMEPFEPLETDEPDIQDLISRWAGESKRLLIALPAVLARLEDLQEDTGRLRERVSDLERENVALRESREELAETFAKLKALIAGTSMAAALDVDALEPRSQHVPAPSAEPAKAERASDGYASEPSSRREAPVPAQSASPPAERPSPPARPPAAPVNPEPTIRVLSREAKPSTSEETGPPLTSVRFSSVFRPPTKS